jgi:hypothetical protein
MTLSISSKADNIIEPFQYIHLLVREIRSMKRDMKNVKRNRYLNSVIDYLHETKFKVSLDKEQRAFLITIGADYKSSIISCVNSRFGKETERKMTLSRFTQHTR